MKGGKSCASYVGQSRPRVEDQVPVVVHGRSYPVLSQRPEAIPTAVSGELGDRVGRIDKGPADPGDQPFPVNQMLAVLPTSPGRLLASKLEQQL